MDQSISRFVAVGSVARPFGVQGEVVVDLLTDFPQRFSKGGRLFLAGKAVTIQRARLSGDRAVVKLDGIDSRKEAEQLRGSLLEIPDKEITPLPSGRYYRFQLLNLLVKTEQGEELGHVVDVLVTGAHDILVVQKNSGKDVLVPATKEITIIDLEHETITVKAIPGLLENQSTPTPNDGNGKG